MIRAHICRYGTRCIADSDKSAIDASATRAMMRAHWSLSRRVMLICVSILRSIEPVTPPPRALQALRSSVPLDATSTWARPQARQLARTQREFTISNLLLIFCFFTYSIFNIIMFDVYQYCKYVCTYINDILNEGHWGLNERTCQLEAGTLVAIG